MVPATIKLRQRKTGAYVHINVQAILTAHYLPRDAEVAGNAIAKLNRYKARRDQKEDGILPTTLPTALKTANVKKGKA